MIYPRNGISRDLQSLHCASIILRELILKRNMYLKKRKKRGNIVGRHVCVWVYV